MDNETWTITAPQQTVADAAIKAYVKLVEMKVVMFQSLLVGGIKWDEFSVLADEFVALCEQILDQYVTRCRHCSLDPDLLFLDALELSSRPAVYIQKMTKQAALHSL